MSLLRNKPMRYWIVAGAFTIAVALAAYFWGRSPTKTVQTTRIQRSGLVAVVTASGEIKPKDSVHISANSFGRIVEILVKEGGFVCKGQVLARLEAGGG